MKISMVLPCPHPATGDADDFRSPGERRIRALLGYVYAGHPVMFSSNAELDSRFRGNDDPKR